jgi:molybdenum cofactor synthesis domain-containing protein
MFRGGVLVVSDRGWRGEREDESGKIACGYLDRLGIDVAKYAVVPDDVDVIAATLKQWADVEGLDVIVTSGGTGLASRDVTPEATLTVIDRAIPGLAEAMRMRTAEKKPEALLSRAVAGNRGKCLIINLPGSPAAVRECLEVILPVIPHAIEILGGKGH